MLHRLAELDALVRKAYAEFDYKTHLRGALGLHDHRPVGVLFRHPQGRALLRSALVADAQGGADRDRPSVPLRSVMARADAVLHRRRSLAARYRPRRRTSVHLTAVPGRAGGLARRRAGGEMGSVRAVRRVVTGALEIERAPSASARRSKPRRSSMSPTPTIFDALVDVDLAEICITSAATLRQGRGAGRRVPAARRARRRGGGRSAPRAPNARARGRSSPTVGERSAISRRHAARRAGAARMGSHAQGGGVRLRRAVTSAVRSPASGWSSRRSPACSTRLASSGCCYVFDLGQPGRRQRHAVLRSRADLEHRHQLRLVPAARARSARCVLLAIKAVARGRCWRSGWRGREPG